MMGADGVQNVVERLEQDECLSVALTCTVLRDHILAPFRKQGTPHSRDSNGGMRGGLCTAVSGVISSLERVEWIWNLESPPRWLSRWNAKTCAIIAYGGQLDAVQWARANGCDWDACTCSYAAYGGHLEVLQWAKANGCEWDADTCAFAAGGGHLGLLQWARSKPNPHPIPYPNPTPNFNLNGSGARVVTGSPVHVPQQQAGGTCMYCSGQWRYTSLAWVRVGVGAGVGVRVELELGLGALPCPSASP